MEFLLAGVTILFLLALLVQDARASKERFEIIKANRAEVEKLLELHRDERRELLNRIQHPERMPTKVSNAGQVRSNVTPETRRALAQVGTVAPQVATDGD